MGNPVSIFFQHMINLNKLLFSFLLIFYSFELSAEEIQMTCYHSFQGNYSGGEVLLKYENNLYSNDKAYIRSKDGWVEICTDVETKGKIKINNYQVSCSMYLANWMNQRRKDFIWNFKTKEFHVQTLWKIMNPKTQKKEWQWSYSIGELFTDNWKVINVWESERVEYNKNKCE